MPVEAMVGYTCWTTYKQWEINFQRLHTHNYQYTHACALYCANVHLAFSGNTAKTLEDIERGGAEFKAGLKTEKSA